jgi:hypothetical protein
MKEERQEYLPDDKGVSTRSEKLDAAVQRYKAYEYAFAAAFLVVLFLVSAILIARLAQPHSVVDLTGYIVASATILLCSWLWLWIMRLWSRARIATTHGELDKVGREATASCLTWVAWSPSATMVLCAVMSAVALTYVMAIGLTVYRSYQVDGPPCCEAQVTPIPPSCSPVVVTCEVPALPPCECTQTCKPIVRPPSCPAAPQCPACPACPACPVASCVPSPTPTCPPCSTQTSPPAADDDP